MMKVLGLMQIFDLFKTTTFLYPPSRHKDSRTEIRTEPKPRKLVLTVILLINQLSVFSTRLSGKIQG